MPLLQNFIINIKIFIITGSAMLTESIAYFGLVCLLHECSYDELDFISVRVHLPLYLKNLSGMVWVRATYLQ